MTDSMITRDGERKAKERVTERGRRGWGGGRGGAERERVKEGQGGRERERER